MNCANFLTNIQRVAHAEVRAALPSLGMYGEREDGEMLSEAYPINVKVGKVGARHKWKPPVTVASESSLAWIAP